MPEALVEAYVQGTRRNGHKQSVDECVVGGKARARMWKRRQKRRSRGSHATGGVDLVETPVTRDVRRTRDAFALMCRVISSYSQEVSGVWHTHLHVSILL
jgi:hypothetical protein